MGSSTACYSCAYDDGGVLRMPCYRCVRTSHNYTEVDGNQVPKRRLRDWYVRFGDTTSLRARFCAMRLAIMAKLPNIYPDGTRELYRSLEAEAERKKRLAREGEAGLFLLERRQDKFFVYDTDREVTPVLIESILASDPFHRNGKAFGISILEKIHYRRQQTDTRYSAVHCWEEPPEGANALYVEYAKRGDFVPGQACVIYCRI